MEAHSLDLKPLDPEALEQTGKDGRVPVGVEGAQLDSSQADGEIQAPTIR